MIRKDNILLQLISFYSLDTFLERHIVMTKNLTGCTHTKTISTDRTESHHPELCFEDEPQD